MVIMVARLSAMALGTSAKRSGCQNNIGRFDGHVGARADGETHVGLGQGRCVVDAVAHHGHSFSPPPGAP